jgi:hypothetical protein
MLLLVQEGGYNIGICSSDWTVRNWQETVFAKFEEKKLLGRMGPYMAG